MVLFNKLALLSLLGPYLHRQIQFIWVDFSSSSQSAHQARMGKTVTRDVSVQQLRTVIQSPEDVPVCLATMETTVSSVSVVVCTEVWLTEEILTGQTCSEQRAEVNGGFNSITNSVGCLTWILESIIFSSLSAPPFSIFFWSFLFKNFPKPLTSIYETR